MKTPKEQLKGLDQLCGQIIKTAELDPNLDSAYYEDRVAQSRTCIWAAIEELKKPQEDSEQFIAQVISEQRDIVEELLREVTETEPAPDTERSPGLILPPDSEDNRDTDTDPDTGYPLFV